MLFYSFRKVIDNRFRDISKSILFAISPLCIMYTCSIITITGSEAEGSDAGILHRLYHSIGE